VADFKNLTFIFLICFS